MQRDVLWRWSAIVTFGEAVVLEFQREGDQEMSHRERERRERKEGKRKREEPGPILMERKKEKEKTQFSSGFGNSPSKRRRLIKK